MTTMMTMTIAMPVRERSAALARQVLQELPPRPQLPLLQPLPLPQLLLQLHLPLLLLPLLLLL